MRSLEAKPHTSVRRINEAQSHGEVCGVGRTAAATAARERRRRGGGGARHSIAYSKMLTNRRRRRRNYVAAASVRSSDHPAGLAVGLASCQPTEQPSERVVWFGGAGPPPAWLLTRFARLNANGRNSVHSPIDFPPIHFTHGQKSQ